MSRKTRPIRRNKEDNPCKYDFKRIIVLQLHPTRCWHLDPVTLTHGKTPTPNGSWRNDLAGVIELMMEDFLDRATVPMGLCPLHDAVKVATLVWRPVLVQNRVQGNIRTAHDFLTDPVDAMRRVGLGKVLGDALIPGSAIQCKP